MSGTLVIWSLIAHNSPVLAVVPITRIKDGDLQMDTVLPAISVTLVDGQPRNTVAMTEPNKMHTDRVQVSALLKSPYGTPAGLGVPGVRALLKLILDACPHTHGTVAGVDVLSIQPDTEMILPEDQEKSIIQGSRDFIVRWRS